MKESCVFCKIISGEKEEDLIYEDEDVVAFHDIHPRTPIHVMIATRRHFDDFSEMITDAPVLLSQIGIVVEELVDQLNIRGKAYTWGFHCGGKQSIHHVHAGLLAGMKEDELVL